MKNGKHIWAIACCLLVTMAMHAQQPFEGAQWIGAITKADARLPEGRIYQGAVLKQPDVKAAWAAADSLSRRSIWLRRTFKAPDDIRQATLHIVGLGFYDAGINGRKVGDALFAPHWSDYDKTVFYNTYDVTAMLKKGQNDIRVLLGNGFFNEQGGRYHKLKLSFGAPTLLLSLDVTYRNGRHERLVSDEQWQWALSQITFNSIYGGEDYDARLVPRQWHKAVVQTAPRGTLRPQQAEPVKLMERFHPKDTLRRDTILLLDMGQNLSGFPLITVRGKAGQRLKLTVGETVKNGLVDQRQTGRPHYYTYTLRGRDTETWHPRFSYYGFRYIQVEGDLEVLRDIQSCFVYNSARRIGTFECSNPLINQTHHIIDRAIRSNWQSVFTDCPHREKLGWLEQDWLNGEAIVYNYDARTMIAQTMQQMADAQHADGAMPETAPEYVVFSGSWAKPFLESPEWGGALIALPLLYEKRYGDDSLMRHYYGAMLRYVDYLATQDSAYILRQGLGDWYDYGPWRAGFARNTPMPLVSTAHYYWWTKQMAGVAAALQRDADAVRLRLRADSIKAAFNRTFYNEATCQYATGSQAAQSIALYMDLAPKADRAKVLEQLVADIHAHGDRLTTGDVGNRYLFYTLAENGQRELLYRMLNHYDVPGYGYQIRQGMTTLTEQWNPEHGASMNHFMMAHIENLLIPDLLGIRLEGSTLTIAPHPTGDLEWCRGTLECGAGTIAADWQIAADDFTLRISVPAGMTATVVLPYSGYRQTVGDGKHELTEKICQKK